MYNRGQNNITQHFHTPVIVNKINYNCFVLGHSNFTSSTDMTCTCQKGYREKTTESKLQKSNNIKTATSTNKSV